MSREIKFRAWIAASRELVPVLLLWTGTEGCGLQYQDAKGNITLSTTAAKEGVTVMQYIGRKDKNGQEIYEGDAVKVTYCGDLAYCHTNPAIFVIHEPEYTALDGYSGGGPDFDVAVAEIEIVGNVFENPELLQN